MEGMLTATEKNKLDMDSNQPQESGEHDKFHSSNELGDEQSNEGVLGELPEVCIAMILSYLPPREVAKLACVCRSFRAASNFDSVWESMLPPRYKDILALDPDVVPAQIASKREIFDHLCKPIFLANRTQVQPNLVNLPAWGPKKMIMTFFECATVNDSVTSVQDIPECCKVILKRFECTCYLPGPFENP